MIDQNRVPGTAAAMASAARQQSDICLNDEFTEFVSTVIWADGEGCSIFVGIHPESVDDAVDFLTNDLSIPRDRSYKPSQHVPGTWKQHVIGRP